MPYLTLVEMAALPDGRASNLPQGHSETRFADDSVLLGVVRKHLLMNELSKTGASHF
jgi:hypothetical protein